MFDFIGDVANGVSHSFDILTNIFSPAALIMLTVVALMIGGSARIHEGEENAGNKVLALVGIVGFVAVYAIHSWVIL